MIQNPGSRYVQLLQGQPNLNNGTMAGGLGHVLTQFLQGKMMGDERREYDDAQGRLSQALQAYVGKPERDMTWNAPAPRPGGVQPTTQGLPAVAGDRSRAAQLLAGNPLTAPMAWDIAMQQDAAPDLDLVQAIDPTTGQMTWVPKEQALGMQSALPPTPAAPKTITTAEGVFVLNPDGTLGQRLGSPTSQGSTSVEVYTGPTGPQVGTISQGYSLQQLEDGSYTMAPIPGGPEDQPLLTPAQQAVDSAFAAEYAASFATGGLADAQKNVEQLRVVQGQLNAVASGQSDANLTGFWAGNLPDEVLAQTNPAALAAREQVEEVVQRNLRLILGPQFTEKEGERLIARAYNPRLKEAENAVRVGRLIGAMETALQAKIAAAQYYEQHGTLQGFEGTAQFTMQYFDDVLGDDPGAPDAPATATDNDPLGIR